MAQAFFPQLELSQAPARKALIQTLVVELAEPALPLDSLIPAIQRAIWQHEGALSSIALYRGQAPEAGLFLVLDYKQPCASQEAYARRATDFLQATIN